MSENNVNKNAYRRPHNRYALRHNKHSECDAFNEIFSSMTLAAGREDVTRGMSVDNENKNNFDNASTAATQTNLEFLLLHIGKSFAHLPHPVAIGHYDFNLNIFMGTTCDYLAKHDRDLTQKCNGCCSNDDQRWTHFIVSFKAILRGTEWNTW